MTLVLDYRELEPNSTSRVCGVVLSRLADLTGLYHVPQVFHITSCQLTYSYMPDENFINRTAIANSVISKLNDKIYCFNLELGIKRTYLALGIS